MDTTIILNDMPEFATAKRKVIRKLEELGNKTLTEGFASQVKGKSAPFSFQTLANLTWQSCGYIRDKFLKWKADTKKDDSAWTEFVKDNLAPLTKEELEALAEKRKHEAEVVAKAESAIAMAKTFGQVLTFENTKDNELLRTNLGDEAFHKLLQLLNT